MFQSHLELAHHFWKLHVRKGDCIIDATSGNGKDALVLAKLCLGEDLGELHCIDIQKEAICSTTSYLSKNLLPSEFSRVHFHIQSHITFPLTKSRPRLIVYNLGYLPGGEKSFTTLSEQTLESFTQALELLSSDGALSIMFYPGHEEGKRELENAISFFSKRKEPLLYFTRPNRPLSPTLLFLYKDKNKTL